MVTQTFLNPAQNINLRSAFLIETDGVTVTALASKEQGSLNLYGIFSRAGIHVSHKDAGLDGHELVEFPVSEMGQAVDALIRTGLLISEDRAFWEGAKRQIETPCAF